MAAEIVTVTDALIHTIRGQRVMLDSDLAALYGVTTGNLNKAVARNAERFPDDFMLQLTDKELAALIFQNGISKKGHGGRRHRPYAFTQEGIAMLSSVLRSERAVAVNIAIMRAFVRLRQLAFGVEELAGKVDALERGLAAHDDNFKYVFDQLRELMAPPDPTDREMGFHTVHRKE